MIDENAFGILLSYFAVEDDEYGLERDQFVTRFQEFRSTVRGALSDLALGSGVRAVDLGHALYVEVGDGDQTESPLAWAKGVRARLTERGFDSMAVVTHGGRWVDEGEWTSVEPMNHAGLVTVSLPSEPFRRALYADAASRPTDEGEVEGWGPGLYLDVDAVEALRIKLRNLPTSLHIGGAEFYRVGS